MPRWYFQHAEDQERIDMEYLSAMKADQIEIRYVVIKSFDNPRRIVVTDPATKCDYIVIASPVLIHKIMRYVAMMEFDTDEQLVGTELFVDEHHVKRGLPVWGIRNPLE